MADKFQSALVPKDERYTYPNVRYGGVTYVSIRSRP